MFKKLLLIASFTVSAAALAQTMQAPAQVQGAWIRATVDGQKATGGFMTLTAQDDLRLVGFSSPAAGAAEVHEMAMSSNNVMSMRPIEGIDLPKGKAVALQPGGYHLMLLNLKQTLAAGSSVPVTLKFKNAKGTASQLTVTVPVSLSPQATTEGASHAGHKH